MNFAEQRYCLSRKRYIVRFTRFHLARRDNPERAIQIDFSPFGVAKFARADKDVGGDLQCLLGYAAAFVLINGAQQFASFLGISDRAIMGDGWRSQRAA